MFTYFENAIRRLTQKSASCLTLHSLAKGLQEGTPNFNVHCYPIASHAQAGMKQTSLPAKVYMSLVSGLSKIKLDRLSVLNKNR